MNLSRKDELGMNERNEFGVKEMRCLKDIEIVLCMAALVACLSTGIAWGYDYLEGGYVSSYDRSRTMDPGISGMVQWLDLPVPASTFVPYREYYRTTLTTVASSVLSSPVQYDLAGQTPNGVYYRNGQWLPFSTYSSSRLTQSNDLWITGQTNWTQYAAIPLGASLQILTNVPSGGTAAFFEVISNNAVKTEYKTLQLNPGYSSMSFLAGQTGRYMFYYVVNNQPSNLIIVDVFIQAPV